MPLQELLGYFANCGDTPGDLTPSLQLGDAGCTGHYRGLSLHSVFQPLLNATTQRSHCHEALLWMRDPKPGSRLMAFWPSHGRPFPVSNHRTRQGKPGGCENR